MITSPSREQDRKARLLMLEGMKIALRTGHLEDAKSLGESARKVKTRITTFDYSQADSLLKKLSVY